MTIEKGKKTRLKNKVSQSYSDFMRIRFSISLNISSRPLNGFTSGTTLRVKQLVQYLHFSHNFLNFFYFNFFILFNIFYLIIKIKIYFFIFQFQSLIKYYIRYNILDIAPDTMGVFGLNLLLLKIKNTVAK